MINRLRIALVVASTIVMLGAQGCDPKPSASKPQNIVIAAHRNGTLTYNGKGVSCEQMNAYFEKMAKDSKEKIEPLSCHEYPFAEPKSRMRIRIRP